MIFISILISYYTSISIKYLYIYIYSGICKIGMLLYIVYSSRLHSFPHDLYLEHFIMFLNIQTWFFNGCITVHLIY